MTLFDACFEQKKTTITSNRKQLCTHSAFDFKKVTVVKHLVSLVQVDRSLQDLLMRIPVFIYYAVQPKRGLFLSRLRNQSIIYIGFNFVKHCFKSNLYFGFIK